MSAQIKSTTATQIHYELDGQSAAARFTTWPSKGGDTHVLIQNNGQTHTYRVTNPLQASELGSTNSNVVTAPMTGIIRVVHAVTGTDVTTDTPLVVLEAMKMETTLVSPRDGTVANVLCVEGDAVSDGDVLIELAEQAD